MLSCIHEYTNRKAFLALIWFHKRKQFSWPLAHSGNMEGTVCYEEPIPIVKHRAFFVNFCEESCMLMVVTPDVHTASSVGKMIEYG
jgi:hypothetical protein